MGKHQILKVAYSPFAGIVGDSLLVKDPRIEELARKPDMGAGQLLLSWAVQRGTIVLSKSQTAGM